MEATLEPRLVMKGDEGKPYVKGEFFVAAYQRGYRWGCDQVHQLLDDIWANAKDAESSGARPSDYFLQPIVVLPRGEGGWELVDGQQRLTTLLLITKYMDKVFAKAGAASSTTREYFITYETRERSREFLDALDTLDLSESPENIDFHYIGQAYRRIEEWFEDKAHGTPLQAAEVLREALTKWVYVIWYRAPRGTDPNDLFVRLNRDRIPLTDSELIKAVVLSGSGAGRQRPGRREEIAGQWDAIERSLRDEQFWAFLTGSTLRRPTHIDFLFESMTPEDAHGRRPRFWTYLKVREAIEQRRTDQDGAEQDGEDAFWRDVVERHAVLTGWFHDRLLFHRIGYLVAIGDSVSDLIQAAAQLTHSAFRQALVERTRKRLDISRDDVSLLQYGKDDVECTNLLLLMNVETVLGANDIGSRFSFHAYAAGGWSLEHIHPQHAQTPKKDEQRRGWLSDHVRMIRKVGWPTGVAPTASDLARQIDECLLPEAGKIDDRVFRDLADQVLKLFGMAGTAATEEDVHGLGNLALLHRDINSALGNAVFALKRERILELDSEGAYILPCTRNAFLKYYTAAEDQQLSVWGPLDRRPYYEKLLSAAGEFLLPGAGSVEGGTA